MNKQTAYTSVWNKQFVRLLNHAHLDQAVVVLRVSFQTQCVKQVIITSIQKLIEDVEVPLTVVLVYYSGFFQQIVQDVTAHWCPLGKVRAESNG